MAALALHPQIEVRLFNPFVLRWPKPLGYVTDFNRANRRMHNKSFTADNQASIVGGRNVGDEYFGATDFDRYWASASAWPVQAIVPAGNEADWTQLDERATAVAASDKGKTYTEAVRQAPFTTHLLAQTLALEWSRIHIVSDDPAKGLGQAKRSGLLVDQLHRVLGKPEKSLSLVSPYFVPTAAGTEALARLGRSGVAVRVLTNGYETTDVPLVHAGYAQYRRALLQSGVVLYEKQRLTAPIDKDQSSPKRVPRLHLLGSSGSSLHAKTLAIDSERAFVGSFNFDPRSALLNTELGFVIDSPPLARQIERAFDAEVPQRAYTLALSANGEIEWRSSNAAAAGLRPTVQTTEPGSHWWSRLGLKILSWLPIEWLL